MAAKKVTDGGAAEVQAKVDAETEQGYVGERTDPTPLENYTVAGVTAGKPTPENGLSDSAADSED